MPGWSLEGADDAEGAVTAAVQVFEGGTFPVASMQEALPTTFFSFFGAATGAADRSTAGEIELEAFRLRSATAVTRLDINWVIDWVVYLPAEATIPLDSVRTVQVG